MTIRGVTKAIKATIEDLQQLEKQLYCMIVLLNIQRWTVNGGPCSF